MRWKSALLALGLLVTAGAALVALQRSGAGCGTLVLGRYSIPLAVGIVTLAVLGIGGIVASRLLSEDAAGALLGRLAALGFGVGLAILLAEGFLRLTDPIPSVEDLIYENHPRLGYIHRTDSTFVSQDEFGEFRHRFTVDSQGLIVRDEPNTTRPDATRVLLLGDSFVEAVQVPAEASMGELLEDRLAAVTGEPHQVINTGHAGYDPLTYLLSYREFAPSFEPEIVVTVFFVGNDFIRPSRLYHDDQLILEGGDLVALRPRFDFEALTTWDGRTASMQPLEVRENGSGDRVRTLGLVRSAVVGPLCRRLEPPTADAVPKSTHPCVDLSGQLTNQCDLYTYRDESLVRNNRAAIFKDAYTPLDREDLGVALTALRALADEVEADGRQLLLVVMPVKAQVPGQGGRTYFTDLEPGTVIDSEQPQQLMADFCAGQGIPCLDLLPVLRAHSDEQLFLTYDPHLTERGHQVVTEAILEALR